MAFIDQRGGAGHFVVGTDNGVVGGVGQRRRRAVGERDGALDLQRRRRGHRAVELNRAAGDGVFDQLDNAAGVSLDGAAGVADVAIDLQRHPGLRLQRGARLVDDGGAAGVEDQLVGKAGDGDRHRLGRAQAVVVHDGDVVDDGERLADGEEIKIATCSAERDADRTRARNRALVAVERYRGRQRTLQHRKQPARQRAAARQAGRVQARAHRVGVEIVDVGEGERAARRSVASLPHRLGDRMRRQRIRIKYRRFVRIDRDRDLLGRARTEAVRILDRQRVAGGVVVTFVRRVGNPTVDDRIDHRRRPYDRDRVRAVAAVAGQPHVVAVDERQPAMQHAERCGLHVADIRVDDMREGYSDRGVFLDRNRIARNDDRGRTVQRRYETDRKRYHRRRVNKPRWQ